MSRRTETIAPDYFDALYIRDEDPWRFRTSDYEQFKYDDTLAVLERDTYPSALEVGCSIGVFTRKLAGRCGELLAVDASAVALEAARRHADDRPGLRFERRMIPDDFPAGRYDLIILSEVIYYLAAPDVVRTADLCARALEPAGEIVLCHWLGETDYPLTGDQAADLFLATFQGPGSRHKTLRREHYRLDHLVFEA